MVLASYVHAEPLSGRQIDGMDPRSKQTTPGDFGAPAAATGVSGTTASTVRITTYDAKNGSDWQTLLATGTGGSVEHPVGSCWPLEKPPGTGSDAISWHVLGFMVNATADVNGCRVVFYNDATCIDWAEPATSVGNGVYKPMENIHPDELFVRVDDCI